MEFHTRTENFFRQQLTSSKTPLKRSLKFTFTQTSLDDSNDVRRLLKSNSQQIGESSQKIASLFTLETRDEDVEVLLRAPE